jgi:hypothetical protein
MSVADPPARPPGIPPEEVRRPFHQLYLLSVPDELRDVVEEFVPEQPVMETVATDMEAAPVWPLYKLHSVASSLVRKPTLADEGALQLANAMAGPVGDRGKVEKGLHDFADRMKQESDQAGGITLTPDLWRQFLIDVKLLASQEPGAEFGLPVASQEEVIGKPGCNDQETIPDEDGASVIISRFWTTYTLDQIKYFVPPMHWVECGAPFWSSVVEVARNSALTGNPADFDGTYIETVVLPVTELRVRLDVQYREFPNLVRLDYDLSPDDEDHQVTRDTGFLSVTTDTYGDQGQLTLVEGNKTIKFADDRLNRLPDLACDGGWVYMMIDMALNGAGVTSPLAPEPPAPTVVHAKPPESSFAPITAKIETEIDAWIDQATASIARHGAAAKDLTRKIMAPQHDPRWVDDVVGMARGVVGMTGATIGAWRRIIRELSELGGPR